MENTIFYLDRKIMEGLKIGEKKYFTLKNNQKYKIPLSNLLGSTESCSDYSINIWIDYFKHLNSNSICDFDKKKLNIIELFDLNSNIICKFKCINNDEIEKNIIESIEKINNYDLSHELGYFSFIIELKTSLIHRLYDNSYWWDYLISFSIWNLDNFKNWINYKQIKLLDVFLLENTKRSLMCLKKRLLYQEYINYYDTYISHLFEHLSENRKLIPYEINEYKIFTQFYNKSKFELSLPIEFRKKLVDKHFKPTEHIIYNKNNNIPIFDINMQDSNYFYDYFEKRINKNDFVYSDIEYDENFEKYLLAYVNKNLIKKHQGINCVYKYDNLIEKSNLIQSKYQNYFYLSTILNKNIIHYYIMSDRLELALDKVSDSESNLRLLLKIFLEQPVLGEDLMYFIPSSKYSMTKISKMYRKELIRHLNNTVKNWEVDNSKNIASYYFSVKSDGNLQQFAYCFLSKFVLKKYIFFYKNDIFSFFKDKLRIAENKLRNDLNIAEVGRGWHSQSLLFERIKSLFPNLEVLSEASPNWLGLMRLDIYIPELNLALEYQGAQHYYPIPIFGGLEGLLRTQYRDRKKYDLCIKNKVNLIYVDEGYDFKLLSERLAYIYNEKHK